MEAECVIHKYEAPTSVGGGGMCPSHSPVIVRRPTQSREGRCMCWGQLVVGAGRVGSG